MLGKNDTQLLNQIDPRLRNVIMTPEQSGDRQALLVVLKLVNAAMPTKRDSVWDHFEKKIGHGLGKHVSLMRSVYAEVDASLTESPAKKRLAAIKAKAAERGLL